MPVATLIDPAGTSEVRSELPTSITQVHEGSRYYVEIWVSDVGMTTNGLSGAYVDVSFCGTTVATGPTARQVLATDLNRDGVENGDHIQPFVAAVVSQ